MSDFNAIVRRDARVRRTSGALTADEMNAAVRARRFVTADLPGERDLARDPDTVRASIARAVGLPHELADRLRGTNVAALVDDARALVAALGGDSPTLPTDAGGFDGGARQSTPRPASMNALVRRQAARRRTGAAEHVDFYETQPPPDAA